MNAEDIEFILSGTRCRIPVVDQSSIIEFERRLACPYYKRFPEQFAPNSTCATSGWDTVHRIK
jgi:hypothetical protein